MEQNMFARALLIGSFNSDYHSWFVSVYTIPTARQLHKPTSLTCTTYVCESSRRIQSVWVVIQMILLVPAFQPCINHIGLR